MRIKNHDIGLRCKKRTTVTIIVTEDGEYYIGSNAISNEVDECPRINMPTEVGYEACKEVCGQKYHSEVAAAAQVPKGRKAVAFLIGHDHSCEPCQRALEAAGVKELVVIDVNAR